MSILVGGLEAEVSAVACEMILKRSRIALRAGATERFSPGLRRITTEPKHLAGERRNQPQHDCDPVDSPGLLTGGQGGSGPASDAPYLGAGVAGLASEQQVGG